MSAEYIKKLVEQGERITPIRQTLVEVLKNSKPLTPQELLFEFKKLGIKPNKTTVYRQLEFLKRNGIVEEVLLGRSKRYELKSNHHHHVVCLKCGNMEDIAVEADLKNQELEIQKKTNYKITKHFLEFFGLCEKCQ